MVTNMFGRQRTEGGLDARIAELSARRARVEVASPAPNNNAPAPEKVAAAPVPAIEPESTIEERLAIAREELSARLGAEIRPERRGPRSPPRLPQNAHPAGAGHFLPPPA